MEKDQLKEIEKEMKDMGCELVLDPIQLVGEHLMVQCDIDIKCEGVSWLNNATLIKTTKRNTKFYCTFNQSENRLTINFFTKVPDYFKCNYDKVFGTTFPDLCWIYSSGTTAENKIEVATEFRSDAIPSDLTWILPSKFVDDLIEMLHTVNPTFMAGLMQDAVVYGPYLVK